MGEARGEATDSVSGADAVVPALMDSWILDALPVGVIVLSGDGQIIRGNTAAEQSLGLSESAMLGRTTMDPRWHAVHEDGTSFPGDIQPAMVALRTGESVAGVVIGVQKPDGTLTWISVSATPIAVDPAGSEPAVLATFADITEQVALRDAARAAEDLYRLLAEHAADVVVKLSDDGVIEWMSPSVTGLLGWTPEEWVGRPAAEVVVPEDVGGLPVWRRALGAGEAPRITVRVRHKDGGFVWVESRIHLTGTDAQGRPFRVASWRDVTEDHELRLAVAESEARYRLLAENATDVVYESDVTGNIAWISSGVRGALGWEPDELVGTPSLDLLHPEDRTPASTRLREAMDAGNGNVAHLRFRARTGGYRWMSARHQPVVDRDGTVTGLVVGLRDVHEEHAMREQLAFLAFHDPLTRLRNRAWILDMLETDLAVARRDRRQVAVLFLDLDNFKVINDSLGHLVGDEVLAATARRISGALRPGDRVGRFGGDEFIVIAPGIRHRQDVAVIAERLCAAVVDEVRVGDRSVIVTASIGIALSEPDSTPMYLLRDADSAMFAAKATGRSRWEFADPATHTQAMSRLDTEAELRGAIAQRQFVVHYQPIVSLADAGVVGHEALVRWQHPERGLLAPLEFLQVAEDTGLILGIEDQVLDQVCDQLNNRPDLAGTISLNKSPVHIVRPGWHDRLLDRLDEHGVDPSRIVIEVTETAILTVLAQTRDDLADLRERGVGIHVDDFGTGYSSIALLRDLPVTGLKLDLSFTRHVTTDTTARALAAGLAGLAEGLGLDGIAEGIETPEQAAMLREQGWSHGQGYLYGRAAPDPVTSVGLL